MKDLHDFPDLENAPFVHIEFLKELVDRRNVPVHLFHRLDKLAALGALLGYLPGQIAHRRYRKGVVILQVITCQVGGHRQVLGRRKVGGCCATISCCGIGAKIINSKTCTDIGA